MGQKSYEQEFLEQGGLSICVFVGGFEAAAFPGMCVHPVVDSST
jgi:hypothetical protein